MLASAAAAVLCVWAVRAEAAPIVDGTLDAAYGTPRATVAYSPAAPTSNFDAPTAASNAVGYDIYSTSDTNFYYGFLRARPDRGGTGIGAFANLYFDLDPANGNGSDLGFEITNKRAFLPGYSGYAENLLIQYAIGTNGNTLEFAIPISYFTGQIAGLNYNNPDYANQQFISSSNPDTVLRLSQSFGYSVAGGAAYGVDRLGRTTLVAPTAVPEPASLAVFGAGLLGLSFVRRRRTDA